MEAASYATDATNTTDPTVRGATPRIAGLRGRAQRRRAVSAGAGPVVRRSDAVVAPERFRELGGLAVSDAVCNLAHGERTGGEHVRGGAHAHGREVVSERGPADLGVGALELAARRCHAA